MLILIVVSLILLFTFITWANSVSMCISSADPENEEESAQIILSLNNRYLFLNIPNIIKPSKELVSFNNNADDTNALYVVYTPRSYGFSKHEDTLTVHHGLSTFDTDTDESTTWSLPWIQKRYVRTSIYTLDGHQNQVPYGEVYYDGDIGNSWPKEARIRTLVPKFYITFNDYDGTEVIAECYIVVGQWNHGEGAFKWLQYFIPAIVHRYIDITFNKGIGPDKHDWKGGTLGISTDIAAQESVVDAFYRFAEKNKLTNVAMGVQ